PPSSPAQETVPPFRRDVKLVNGCGPAGRGKVPNAPGPSTAIDEPGSTIMALPLAVTVPPSVSSCAPTERFPAVSVKFPPIVTSSTSVTPLELSIIVLTAPVVDTDINC